MILHGVNSRNEDKGEVRNDKWLNKEQVKELQRRQFFNFFADFYDKYDSGQFKGKNGY